MTTRIRTYLCNGTHFEQEMPDRRFAERFVELTKDKESFNNVEDVYLVEDGVLTAHLYAKWGDE